MDLLDATRQASAVVERETADPAVRPGSRSRLLSHGSRTERAVLATWLAQNSADVVRHLLLLSPFFGPDPRQAPAWAVRPLTFLYGRGLLPDRVTSRGYSLTAVTRYLAIAHRLPGPPRRTRLRSLAVVISETDGVVDPVAAFAVPRRIAAACGIRLRTHTLPASLGVGHDTLALIGPGAAGLRERYIELSEGRP
ncbi:hypothetical protein [Paractinoplanes deccanensis]